MFFFDKDKIKQKLYYVFTKDLYYVKLVIYYYKNIK